MRQGARHVNKQPQRNQNTEKRMDELNCPRVYLKAAISEIVTKEQIWEILKTNVT